MTWKITDKLAIAAALMLGFAAMTPVHAQQDSPVAENRTEGQLSEEQAENVDGDNQEASTTEDAQPSTQTESGSEGARGSNAAETKASGEQKDKAQ